MTVLPITCDNCGAKYKLPPTFTGDQAKCQKCGSVIDVARQRAGAAAGDAPAAAKPAAPKPAAAARPAVDRSKSVAREPAQAAAAPARTARSTRSSARAAKADADGGADEATPRRGGRERPAKKSNAMPLILSAVGLVVVVGAAWLVLGGGNDKPATDANAKVDKPAPTAAPRAAAPPEQPAEPAPAKPAEPAPAAAPAAAAKPATPPADAAAASTPPPAAEPEDPARPKRPWEKLRNAPQSMDQVTDPKSYPEVKWPAAIDDAKKAELRSLAEDAATDSGLRGIRAMKALAEQGYGAMFAIVERLRLLNYMSTEDSMTAFALNKALEEITAGQNARFEPVEASETLVPAKAEWNTMSVKGWIDALAKYPDEESFKKARAERLKKQAESNK